MTKPQKNTATKIKQLKKMDFLNAVPTEPTTKAALIDSLADFEFHASYVDYLMDHFSAQGKIVVNEDGTFNKRPSKQTSARDLYRVEWQKVEGEEKATPVIVHKKLEPGEKMELTDGWATTKKKAVKNMTSKIHQAYVKQVAEVKVLLQTDTDVDEENVED